MTYYIWPVLHILLLKTIVNTPAIAPIFYHYGISRLTLTTKALCYKRVIMSKYDDIMLCKNAVAQMLAANGHRLFFYTHYNAENAETILKSILLYPITAKPNIRYTLLK